MRERCGAVTISMRAALDRAAEAAAPRQQRRNASQINQG
jgi:hypothetical protein